MKTAQRDATRAQIVEAALIAISEASFDGVSTRAIAKRANVSQGLLTYHFKSKEELWRAAANCLFQSANQSVTKVLLAHDEAAGSRILLAAMIRELVTFSASHPVFMRFIMEHGRQDSERSRWLVDTHVAPIYALFAQAMGDASNIEIAHAFYVLTGACSLIFAVPCDCQRLTGINPYDSVVIKRHADYVIKLMVPECES